MTQQATTGDQEDTWSRAARRPAAVAGIGYTVAWVLSFVVAAPMPSVAASGDQVVAAYAGRDWPAIVNLVLSEGIAAVALAAVVLLVARAARRAGAGRAGLAVAVSGVAAAAVSWAELVMAAWLQFGPVASGHGAAAGTLYSAVWRIDGAKLLVLAAMAVALAVLSLTSAVLPRWLAPLGLLLAVSLVIAGLGLVLLADGLSVAVFVSGILLLVVVTATGLTLRTSR
ncbi:MAG TPA: hypothetical protein VGM53_13375 [Streptosporangiaceae bacterium]